MKFLKTSLVAFLILFSFFKTAGACDLCSVYISNQASGQTSKGFQLGVSQQYTFFGTLQKDGRKIPNPSGQYMDSFITQFLVGYGFNDRFGIQLNLPFIYRSYERPMKNGMEKGSESGIGDLILLGKLKLADKQTEDFSIQWHLLGGVKFPTGSSKRLKEEIGGHSHAKPEDTHPSEGDHHSDHSMHTVRSKLPVLHHAGHDHGEENPSGVHGHDLALGSGSFDAIVGTTVALRWHRFLATHQSQIQLRTRGSYDYRHGNDAQWNVGLGGYILMNHTMSLALQARASGEYKWKDELGEVVLNDTGMHLVNLGPELAFTYKNHLSSQLGADFPVLRRNSEIQLVPTYRMRAGVSWRF